MTSRVSSPLPAAITLYNVVRGSEALALAQMAQDEKNIVYVGSHDRDIDNIAAALTFFAPDLEVLSFPAWDCLPYDRSAPAPAITAARLSTLSALCNPPPTGKSRVLLTTVSALLQALPPKPVMQSASMAVRTGQTLSRETLIHFLLARGYQRLGKAMEAGEFAVRGSIIDIIPPGQEEGLRLDFFGDVLETIRLFDPLSQVSTSKAEEFIFQPVGEVMLSEESITRFREGYRELFGAITRDDPLYETISSGAAHSGQEHWLPLFYEHTHTLFDYVPNMRLVASDNLQELCTERHALIRDYYDARIAAKRQVLHGAATYNPLPPERLYIMETQWQHIFTATKKALFSSFAQDRTDSAYVDMGFKPTRNFSDVRALEGANLYDSFREYVQLKRGQGKSVLLACYTQGSMARMKSMLSEHQLHVVEVHGWKDAARLSGKSVGVCCLALENGFETNSLVLLSEQDLLGERIRRTVRKKKKSDTFLAEAASFLPGELVVHRDHGIGRFEGLVTVEVSGNAHDCLKLVYEGDDKLFLPVENIDMVSRYGTEDETTRLDKLGAASWQSRKARLKERIKIAAEALMKIAAERATKPAEVLGAPAGLYEEFAARFPYMETEDQARSIQEVMEDLTSGKPMDRLICGDVGFGKTEVALRAAFIASFASESKVQVALVCPTTLLARQHYKNFKARFEGLPIVIRQLSRMVSAKDAKDTREKLKEGQVDIVIGTHALLAKDISFKNLGLLIIDEEQHFGVGQKEKLKTMKADIHVLTLSATPIPRTLQMALTGVRDLSLITTPPVDRLAIRSFVMPFDPVVIREALMREHHRGGRSFCVIPRIKDIAEMKDSLSKLVPELKLCVAHGQLAAGELDRIMNDFYDGKYDILLSTAIIESGLDIPTANTIIVHKADKFGLAQLYQMRGRVGRGKTRAYAYFTLPHHKQLSKQATKRLEVMQTLDSLGAGFSLASHDMDIRGFGNLVGEEQSGHVREVGIELYQQMLEDAVESIKHAARGEAAIVRDEDWSPQINLGLAVLIPERYVHDLQLRLGLYRRVAELASEAEIQAFGAELVDRFGPLPQEVEQLLSVLRIKILCREAGVERVDAGPKGAVLTFRKNSFAKPEKLIEYIAKNAKRVKLRSDQKLVLMEEWQDTVGKISGVKESIAQIALLAA